MGRIMGLESIATMVVVANHLACARFFIPHLKVVSIQFRNPPIQLKESSNTIKGILPANHQQYRGKTPPISETSDPVRGCPRLVA